MSWNKTKWRLNKHDWGTHALYDILRRRALYNVTFKVPRRIKILFDGWIENLFWNIIPQNRDQHLFNQYRLSVIFYDFLWFGIFSVK